MNTKSTVYWKILWAAILATHGFFASAATFNVRDFGAKGDGLSDEGAAFKKVVLAVRDAGGGEIYIPAGRYAHADVIIFGSNTVVRGDGPKTVLVGTTPTRSAIIVDHAKNTTIENLELASDASQRLQAQTSAALVVNDSTSCRIDRIVIRGSASAGILVAAGSKIEVSNNDIRDTLADGIHVVGGASFVTVEDNYAENTGDDSFSAVSYAAQKPQTSNVTFSKNVSRESRARGVTCIGASNCRISNNTVYDSKGHGIAVALEKAYNTQQPTNATLVNNFISISNPIRGTNSVLLDHVSGATISGLRLKGGNIILVNESSNVKIDALQLQDFPKVPIAVKGGNQIDIRAIERDGNKLPDALKANYLKSQ